MIRPTLNRLKNVRANRPVRMTGAAEALYDRALALAVDESRSDADAVAELRADCRDRMNDAKAAFRYSTVNPLHADLVVENRAHRLLEAVVSGADVVREVSRVELQRLESIQQLDDMEPIEVWTYLVEKVPELAKLRVEAQTLAFVSRTEAGGADNAERRARGMSRATRLEVGTVLRKLEKRVEELVGPDANIVDPVLASQYVCDYAKSGLTARFK